GDPGAVWEGVLCAAQGEDKSGADRGGCGAARRPRGYGRVHDGEGGRGAGGGGDVALQPLPEQGCAPGRGGRGALGRGGAAEGNGGLGGLPAGGREIGEAARQPAPRSLPGGAGQGAEPAGRGTPYRGLPGHDAPGRLRWWRGYGGLPGPVELRDRLRALRDPGVRAAARPVGARAERASARGVPRDLEDGKLPRGSRPGHGVRLLRGPRSEGVARHAERGTATWISAV
ncbi:MAG: Transcriptional regulator, AcrR family, partial [uncultured Rubrobacteraceae bacterium]